MSQITSGSNNGMYGKKHTKESKEKMSVNSKGKTSGEKNGMYNFVAKCLFHSLLI